ncbi:MAG TPA: XRE family transcriptional regulator [Lachnoclostridium sp.]|nr:XRE family transcriptional regulator [Lachnoclostridium sp.]
MSKKKTLSRFPIDSADCGEIIIYLEKIMAKRNVSPNQLSFLTEMQRTQLRNYRDNKMQRLDMDILKRLCYVLECDLHELIEYIPSNKP